LLKFARSLFLSLPPDHRERFFPFARPDQSTLLQDFDRIPIYRYRTNRLTILQIPQDRVGPERISLQLIALLHPYARASRVPDPSVFGGIACPCFFFMKQAPQKWSSQLRMPRSERSHLLVYRDALNRNRQAT